MCEDAEAFFPCTAGYFYASRPYWALYLLFSFSSSHHAEGRVYTTRRRVSQSHGSLYDMSRQSPDPLTPLHIKAAVSRMTRIWSRQFIIVTTRKESVSVASS